ncbi:hypothetical protein GCM10010211_39930 [Streptomyces albospinus]|uniref:Uncharacterized protein n=1 Tax=Streptomyces albospinus TaxID=285515 RepID=A0ABQ2V7K1_9ACTN|nr:hypothetical protein GCM10010211_39930 [Streptomyces albospinus]
MRHADGRLTSPPEPAPAPRWLTGRAPRSARKTGWHRPAETIGAATPAPYAHPPRANDWFVGITGHRARSGGEENRLRGGSAGKPHRKRQALHDGGMVTTSEGAEKGRPEGLPEGFRGRPTGLRCWR